ncbi:MAG: phosphatidate cytidylyltransferase [Clostridia bacterium]|nr:phosphatidate cytidylyltransferase [Clostridia bacterium]
MLIRILSSLLGCAIIIPVLIFSQTWAFPIFMALVSLISVYEMLRCLGVHKKYYLTVPFCIFGAALPLIARLSTHKTNIDFGFIALAVCAVSAIFLLTVSLFSREKFNIEKASTVFLTLFYIVGGYTALVLLRDFDGVGKYVYLLTFVGAWFTDIFAYFTGRFLGKHKLIPDISPKKTVEGSIGGIVFCMIAYVVYGVVLQNMFGLKPNYIVLATVAILISFVSQVGDLTLSAVKRKFGIKDFGKIMPGHGGLLDRFDSVIPVAILLYITFRIVELFGVKIFTLI